MADDFREPESLRRELQSLHAPPFGVPSRMDDAIRNRARAELARHGRMRLLRWTVAAAVACLAIVGGLMFRTPTETIQTTQFAANQRVTIIDALKLARQIQDGSGRDFNGDGTIDSRDVDAVAMVAVRLDGGVQ